MPITPSKLEPCQRDRPAWTGEGDTDVKRYRTNGQHIKELREKRERRATQKEFAYEARISERHLRQIENQNAAVPVDVLERIAKALGVPWQAIVFASEQPRLVPAPDENPSIKAAPEKSELTRVPRFDTDGASVVRDEADLFESARDSHVVVSHVLTKLTPETESYAEEMLDLLESVSWEKRDILTPIPGRDELRLRGRLRELLVLLKGNDVWVYMTQHSKYFPESFEVQPKRHISKMPLQAIVAFGPPGEYGEDTLNVPVDHGQPWLYDPNAEPVLPPGVLNEE